MSDEIGFVVIVCSKCYNPMFGILGNKDHRWYCPTCKVFRTEESSVAQPFVERKGNSILCSHCRKKEAREFGLCPGCKLMADQKDYTLKIERQG